MRKSLSILLVILILLVCALTGVAWWRWNVAEIQEVPFSVQVKDGMLGFNAGTDQLYFGSMPPGGFGERKINLQTLEQRTVVIKVHGEQASWIRVSENGFSINGTREVIFRCNVPSDAAPGNYSGTVRVEFRRTATFK
jgi:hypothetical protein